VTEPDDLTRRLDDLGRATPPPPSDALLASLDADRLRRAPEHRAKVFRLPVVLPAAAVAALVLGCVLRAVGGGSSEPRTVTIATASDASVLQADRSVPAEEGLQLQEGDHITTGPTGSVTVAGETLGPNEEAVIRGGRLRRLRQYLRRHASTTTTTAPALASAPTTAPTATSRPLAPTTSPPTTATTSRADIPVAVQLVGRRLRNGNVGLAWSAYEGADFGGYVVLREDRDVVARRPSVDGREAVDRAAPPGPTRYVVVVLDAARTPIARSQVVRL
jgi:hypothetical protein